MKQLKALLKRNKLEKSVSKEGVFSDWTLLADVDINGGALQFTEARVIGLRGNEEHECFEVPVEIGKFTVECRVAKYGADARVAAMRAYPSGTEVSTLSIGEKVKELPVDLGGIAVVDIGTVHKSMNEDEDRMQKWYDEVLYGDSDDTVAIHTWKPTKTKIPRVESGFGDGSYPLFLLLKNRRPVGLLVEFIEEGAKYPFTKEPKAASKQVRKWTWVEVKVRGFGEVWSFCDDWNYEPDVNDLIYDDIESGLSWEVVVSEHPETPLNNLCSKFKGIDNIKVYTEEAYGQEKQPRKKLKIDIPTISEFPTASQLREVILVLYKQARIRNENH